MSSDVRIRMEGKVEQAERALWAWELAAKSLDGSFWGSGNPFAALVNAEPEVNACLAALGRVVPQPPELKALIARFAKARETVRVKAMLRLQRLGIGLPVADLRSVLGELRTHHPIRYEARLGWEPWKVKIWLGIGALGILGIIASLVSHFPPIGLLGVFASAMQLGILGWRSTPVLLTQRSLVVGERSAGLEQVLGIDVVQALLTNRNGKSFEMIVTLRDHAAWRAVSGGDPAAFLKEVKALGIRVQCEERWFFW